MYTLFFDVIFDFTLKTDQTGYTRTRTRANSLRYVLERAEFVYLTVFYNIRQLFGPIQVKEY